MRGVDDTAFGQPVADRAELDNIVFTSLERAGLLTEVENRLQEPGTSLSGGQQQRLCIARTIAVKPDIILMDEPASALDPIATARIEDLIHTLKERYTIVIVTHELQSIFAIGSNGVFLDPETLTMLLIGFGLIGTAGLGRKWIRNRQ